MKCPACDGGLDQGFIYVRGIGGALFWARTKDIGFLARKGLEQIDLNAFSVTGTARKPCSKHGDVTVARYWCFGLTAEPFCVVGCA